MLGTVLEASPIQLLYLRTTKLKSICSYTHFTVLEMSQCGKFPIMSSEKLGIWAVWCDPRACTIHRHHWGCPGTPRNASSSHNSFKASYKLECFSLAFSHWVVGIALITTLLAQDMCMSKVGILSSLHARHPELSFVPRRRVNLKLDLGETLTKTKEAKKGVSMLFIKITCVIMQRMLKS